jgi:hypothetical protein
VKRVLISAGDLEYLRDEIVVYGKRVKEYLKDTTIIVQNNGIHNDPLLDFLVGEEDLGYLTPRILDWIKGCQVSGLRLTYGQDEGSYVCNKPIRHISIYWRNYYCVSFVQEKK